MEVKINKEIRNYTESIFFGLSLRECFFSVVACVVAIIIYLSTIDLLGLEVTSWLCMLGAFPFAALGFIKYQGMTAEQIVMVAVRSLFLMIRELYDQPINLHYKSLTDYMKEKQKEAIGKHDKKLWKIKKIK